MTNEELKTWIIMQIASCKQHRDKGLTTIWINDFILKLEHILKNLK